MLLFYLFKNVKQILFFPHLIALNGHLEPNGPALPIDVQQFSNFHFNRDKCRTRVNFATLGVCSFTLYISLRALDAFSIDDLRFSRIQLADIP